MSICKRVDSSWVRFDRELGSADCKELAPGPGPGLKSDRNDEKQYRHRSKAQTIPAAGCQSIFAQAFQPSAPSRAQTTGQKSKNHGQAGKEGLGSPNSSTLP